MKVRIYLIALMTFAGSPLAGSAAGPARTETEQKDPEAIFQKGRAHLSGKGALKSPAKALELMKQAAEMGHAEALGGVGYFYATGTAVPRDDQEAVKWFRKGAE